LEKKKKTNLIVSLKEFLKSKKCLKFWNSSVRAKTSVRFIECFKKEVSNNLFISHDVGVTRYILADRIGAMKKRSSVSRISPYRRTV
ncbi:hypothetical protein, partial [Italian clover phyllody phytoplasma]|uniref:hypothetical protein n=1 Tax=Italian clover phyllody phytoplasma TaxID=1196420 RepID=UPI0005538A61